MRNVLLLVCGFLSVGTASAAEQDFVGEWMVYLQDRQRTLVGLLQVERHDGQLSAHLEGGPAHIDVRGNDVTITADSRDVRGFVFDREAGRRIGGRTNAWELHAGRRRRSG